jgi:hypothetical protein
VILSDNRIFLAIGGALGALGLLSFVAVVILKVATGHALEFYYTPRFAVPYVAALATMVVAVAAMAFAGALRFIDWYARRRNEASLNPDP